MTEHEIHYSTATVRKYQHALTKPQFPETTLIILNTSEMETTHPGKAFILCIYLQKVAPATVYHSRVVIWNNFLLVHSCR